MFIGAFLSNIGSWMQNVVLGALAYDLFQSPTFVGVLLFAQLGPLLLFSLVGGMLADAFDRRRLLVTVSLLQGLLSLVLASWLDDGDPSKVALVGIVFLDRHGPGRVRPTYRALLPALVGHEDLPGAISLNSAQMNGSRVIGPIIGALRVHRGGRVVGLRRERAVLPARDLVAPERAAAHRMPDTSGPEGWRGCWRASRPPRTT